MKNPLPRRDMGALRAIVDDQEQWKYLRYVESQNANGDKRIPILSFSEWLNDGKPLPVTVR